MAYSVPFTDDLEKGSIVVEDGTLNEQTSIKLPGRNYTGYGNAIAENFLHLLENFASSNQPSRAIEGQLWYDTTQDSEQLKLYDGTSWIPAGNVNRSAIEPDTAQEGDLWANTENQQLYLKSENEWILVGPNFSDGLSTGASPTTIVGTDNEEYSVVLIEVQAQPVAIISTGEFTPKTAISGFTRIRPGINLTSRDITGAGNTKFIGTSEKAEALVVGNDTIGAANFLRGDVQSRSNFPLIIQNNDGVSIGTDSALTLGIDGQAGLIQHNIDGSNIDIRMRDQGTTRTVVRIDSSQNVGINNQAPDEALDVNGNIQTNSAIFVDGTENSNEINEGSIITRGGAGIAKNLNVGGNSRFANLSTFANIVPDGPNTRNIGVPEARFKNIYATTFVGTLEGNVLGTVSGASGEAERLSNSTSFQIIGDVTSQSVTFNGSGNLTKTFETSISNSFIGDKDRVTDSVSDDELLLNRVSGTTGLFKISVDNLLDRVPENPPGVIMPYAGDSVPAGWLLCDGSEYSQSTYQRLHDAIGDKFGSDVESGNFRVPDLRGRLPLGADNMGGTSADRVTADYADGVGQAGGSDQVSIEVENLPDHEHDLKGDSGDQYYAIRDVAGTPNDKEARTYDAPTGLGNGQAYPSSGGVIDGKGNPLDIMNPTLTINYIIYTGRAA